MNTTTNLPSNWPSTSDWTEYVGEFFSSQAAAKLMTFVEAERLKGNVFPSHDDVFNAFRITSYENTKVVILGQDPYHGQGQAHGLSFSVPEGAKIPPSLRNIFKELTTDERPTPESGDLTSWAEQGVLLLNTVLTVNENQAGSHRNQGWEQFTDLVIASLNKHAYPIVFVLWGKPAEKKQKLIDAHHLVLTSPHPSPLSAYRGFFGSQPFQKVNAALKEFGREPIRWLPSF